MLTEITFMKGYLTLCVSIIELQINYKICFKEAVQQFKSQKNVKKILMMKRKRFAFWICGRQDCQKNLHSQNIILIHPQNFPKIL